MRMAACRMSSCHDEAANLDSALALLEQVAAADGLAVLADSVHARRPGGYCRNVRPLIDAVNRIAVTEARFAMLPV
ncbi:hypothetical protein ACFQS7_29090 [Dankookia sp. GCM10030260]|uniref:hypothetical protein n=1 Tax=Dankookia sp. GCM10030260 TaxID=3273390 RepID=UPI00361E8704